MTKINTNYEYLIILTILTPVDAQENDIFTPVDTQDTNIFKPVDAQEIDNFTPTEAQDKGHPYPI